MKTDNNNSTDGKPAEFPSSAACSGLECLSVWLLETIRWDAHHEKGNHTEAYIVAKDIKAVWKWLASDLADEGVEIRSIIQKDPVLAVIPHIQNETSAATGSGRNDHE